MKKEKNKLRIDICWACGASIRNKKEIPSCKPNHYKLFLKSFSGETIEQLLERLPEARKFL